MNRKSMIVIIFLLTFAMKVWGITKLEYSCNVLNGIDNTMRKIRSFRCNEANYQDEYRCKLHCRSHGYKTGDCWKSPNYKFCVCHFIRHFIYWLLYDSFGRYEKRTKRKLKLINNQRDDEYYVIIIGTGFSGLGMAIKMNELEMDNYFLIERHGHIGGT
ncbi:unnamed protein product [Rotaria sp. Silwood1]|nr:unnamed protein product [Rotaria sp. Silwood1]CAF1265892.1 unnamed protein product [Rotaria sp. Silwood1]